MAGGVLVHQIGGNTTSTKGDQRSLIDAVMLVNAKATPFMSMVPKGPRVDSMVYEWPLDQYEDADDLATVDGTDVTNVDNAQEDYTVVANRLQWNRDTAGVSFLSKYQNQAGVPNKEAYAKAKKLKAILYSVEAALCSEQDVQVGGGAQPNKCRGVGSWLQTSISTSGYAVDSDYLPNSSQILSTATGSVVESTLNGAMGATWDRGGISANESWDVLCGRLFKERISSLTGYASGTNTYQSVKTYNADLSKKILWGTIDTFRGDYGEARLHLSHWLAHANIGGSAAKNQRYAYGLLMKSWDMVDGNAPSQEELAYLGGKRSWQFSFLFGLRCYDPKSNFAIKSTSA